MVENVLHQVLIKEKSRHNQVLVLIVASGPKLFNLLPRFTRHTIDSNVDLFKNRFLVGFLS